VSAEGCVSIKVLWHLLRFTYFVHDLLGDAHGTSEHITSSDVVSAH